MPKHSQNSKTSTQKKSSTSKTQSSMPSLIEQMKQESAQKPDTTRFTLDLDPDRKHKLEALAAQTGRTKSSVLKFLIDAAYAQLES